MLNLHFLHVIGNRMFYKFYVSSVTDEFVADPVSGFMTWGWVGNEGTAKISNASFS